MAMAGQDGGGRAGRGVRIALAASVALNLLVAGVVAGAVLREGGPHGRMTGAVDFGPFTDALSREDRDALRAAFLDRMPQMRDMRREMLAEFGAVLGALRAEPFDPAALRGVMEAQSDRMGARLRIGQDLLLERLTHMTPGARAAFADRLEERLRHGPGGRDGGDGPGD